MARKTTPQDRAAHIAIGCARNLLTDAVELFRTNPSAGAFVALDAAMHSYQDSCGLRRSVTSASEVAFEALVTEVTQGHAEVAGLIGGVRYDRTRTLPARFADPVDRSDAIGASVPVVTT